MGYEVLAVNDFNGRGHWVLVEKHVQNHHHVKAKYENPHIEKVWADKIGHHDWLYCVHIKTGHLGNHHHWTVVFEIRNGH